MDVAEALQLEELKPQTQLPLKRQIIDRSDVKGGRNKHLFRQFWNTVGEFDTERFRRGTVLVKVYLILKQPIDMILRFLIPVVDMEKPLYGWSKLLFNLQVILVPTYIAYIISEIILKCVGDQPKDLIFQFGDTPLRALPPIFSSSLL